MELHDAIKTIVDQFGKEVLTEERFVNILSDVYPNRDNPAMMGIIRTLVKEGYCSDLLSCDENSVQVFISKTTLALNKKNGYDKKLVEDILYSLALGSGIVSPKVNTGTAPTKPAQLSKPSRLTPHKPVKLNNQTIIKPTTQSSKGNNKLNKLNRLFTKLVNINSKRAWLFLLLGYIGLFTSPFVMMLYESGMWYLFFTLCALIFLHSITIVPCGFFIEKLRPKPLYGGLFCGIIICAIFCLFVGITEYDRELLEFWGMRQSPDVPNFLTMIVLAICVFAYLMYASLGAHIAGIDVSPFFDDFFDGLVQGLNYSGGGRWLKPIGQSLLNIKFMMGIILSVLLFGGFYYSLHQTPIWYGHYVNNKSMEIKESRSTTDISLSFADFRIRTDIDTCIKIIDSSPNYSLVSIRRKEISTSGYNSGPSLRVNERYYSDFVDSSLIVVTNWDNHEAKLELFSYKKKLIAIELNVEHHIDSLVSLYSMKYGEPEEYYNNEYNKFEFSTNHRCYLWTFKNGIIQISGIKNRLSSKEIIYFDRSLEPLLEKKEKEERIKKDAEEKRISDSIARINKAKEESEKQERIRQEQEHNKSIKQI